MESLDLIEPHRSGPMNFQVVSRLGHKFMLNLPLSLPPGPFQEKQINKRVMKGFQSKWTNENGFDNQ